MATNGTLLEIIVLSLLLSLTAAVSVPQVAELREGIEIKQQTDAIAREITLNARIAKQTNKALTYRLPESALASREEIVFYPTGATTPVTIKIRKEHKLCSLTLSLRGRLRKRCN